MPSRQRTLIRVAAIAALAVAGSAHAQNPQGRGAAAAISEAVQQGTTPYRPDPDATAASIQSEECRELADQVAVAPRRQYRESAQGIENAQGRPVPQIERNRPRRTLQQAYREKCLN
ncbi:hypothetical protein [Cupriavidus necator]|uniref:hypothetical protein n=1 Tax=Cupriavidus necator TaxID=106590 RepID=UPI00339D60AE